MLRPPCSSLAFGRSFLPPLSLSPLVGLRSPLVHSRPARHLTEWIDGGRCFMHGMGGRLCRLQTLRLALTPGVVPRYRLRLQPSPLAPLPPPDVVVWVALDVLDRMDIIHVLRLILFACFLVTAPLRYAVTRSAMREYPI